MMPILASFASLTDEEQQQRGSLFTLRKMLGLFCSLALGLSRTGRARAV